MKSKKEYKVGVLISKDGNVDITELNKMLVEYEKQIKILESTIEALNKQREDLENKLLSVESNHVAKIKFIEETYIKIINNILSNRGYE